MANWKENTTQKMSASQRTQQNQHLLNVVFSIQSHKHDDEEYS